MLQLCFALCILSFSFESFAQNACKLISGNEYVCEKTNGLLKVVYDQSNNRVAYVQIDQDFQVASWYSVGSSGPIVFDSGKGSILITPEIRGEARCGKNHIKFRTFNIFDNERIEVTYLLTQDGLIIDEDIVCKKI